MSRRNPYAPGGRPLPQGAEVFGKLIGVDGDACHFGAFCPERGDEFFVGTAVFLNGDVGFGPAIDGLHQFTPCVRLRSIDVNRHAEFAQRRGRLRPSGDDCYAAESLDRRSVAYFVVRTLRS